MGCDDRREAALIGPFSEQAIASGAGPLLNGGGRLGRPIGSQNKMGDAEAFTDFRDSLGLLAAPRS